MTIEPDDGRHKWSINDTHMLFQIDRGRLTAYDSGYGNQTVPIDFRALSGLDEERTTLQGSGLSETPFRARTSPDN